METDKEYVEDILRDMPKNVTPDEFLKRCQNDTNAGWGAEVIEASHRYFKTSK